MSTIMTSTKSPWTSKVNSFLYANLDTSPLDGILCEHQPLCIVRVNMPSTDVKGDAEEAQELISCKAYSWTRRRKRHGKARGSYSRRIIWRLVPDRPAHRTPAGVVQRLSDASRLLHRMTGT